jgi:hypothetical protein
MREFEAFSGSKSYLMTAKHLRSVVGGGISGFSKFTPVCFPHIKALFTIMRAFLVGGNCFFLTGTFACYVAGVLRGYKGVYI